MQTVAALLRRALQQPWMPTRNRTRAYLLQLQLLLLLWMRALVVMVVRVCHQLPWQRCCAG